jgi:hypothetical protein
MRAAKTHFEQIPVETVKRIANELHETGVVPVQDEITPAQEQWRKLARQIQQERDSTKMTKLVHQLLTELDERVLCKGFNQSRRNRP